jgi:hypothetical protein
MGRHGSRIWKFAQGHDRRAGESGYHEGEPVGVADGWDWWRRRWSGDGEVEWEGDGEQPVGIVSDEEKCVRYESNGT